MSTRIRGAEATIRVTVADEFAASFGIYGVMEGSFFKVRDFTSTPRTDLVEQDFLGEEFDDLDVQHHGWDFAFTIDENDPAAINYMSLITYKEENHLPPPVVGVQVTYKYRDTTVLARTENYINCVLKLGERSVGGRKEYITNAFEGKSKRREVSIG